MYRPKVKICGVRTLEDARFCAGAGADFLGFVQHRASPRYVEPERAAEIVEWIRGPAAVGVFVDQDAASVNQICEVAGFDFAQLHGDESPDTCAAVTRPVIKAFRVSNETAVELQNRIAAFDGAIEYALLDTYVDSSPGGTGEVFDWRVTRGLETEIPWFLAGGLTPRNVATAVAHVSPFGVDVSSGVESAPGEKDFNKVRLLFDVLKGASVQ